MGTFSIGLGLTKYKTEENDMPGKKQDKQSQEQHKEDLATVLMILKRYTGLQNRIKYDLNIISELLREVTEVGESYDEFEEYWKTFSENIVKDYETMHPDSACADLDKKLKSIHVKYKYSEGTYEFKSEPEREE